MLLPYYKHEDFMINMLKINNMAVQVLSWLVILCLYDVQDILDRLKLLIYFKYIDF